MSKEQTPKEYRNNIHYWNESMSKEQTPITAEEFLERIGHDKDVICESMFGKPYLQSSVSDLMEQYAQYREKKAVLEALEREQEDLERMYLLGRYERGESDKKMDLIDTSKSVIDELLRNRSKTKL
jgi:hypothetical protein